ncbi:MAG: FAD-binding oxidoreductase [Arachnia sp.]
MTESIDATRGAPGAEGLRGLCGGRVYLPGDPGYDEARVPWAVHVDLRPAAVALPGTADEVRELVEAAARAGLAVAPQGSGHGAGPLAGRDLSGAVLIRLTALTGVTIDAERRLARVLGGTEWQEVVEAAAPYGLAALHGSSPDVSVVGYTLGGGVSWFARQHGLAAHHVRAVELVLPDGRAVRADAEHEHELFWALKGGGGNFGVVTAIEFDLLPIADAVAGMMFWPLERAADVLPAWVSWTREVPETVSTSMRLMNLPPLPELPPFLRGRRLIVVDGTVLGADERAAELLAPLRALGPEMDTFTRVPAAALTRIHMDPEGPTPSVSNAVVLSDLPGEAVTALLDLAGPGTATALLSAEIRHLGGALRRPADAALEAVAGEYLGFFVAIAATPEAGAQGYADGARAVAALAPWASGETLLNFAENPADVSTAFAPDAWRRLQAVREAVDPEGRLVAPHPL